MNYLNEHTFIGQLGHFLVLLAFVSVIISISSYFFSDDKSNQSNSWKKIARISFWIHSISVIMVVGIMFWMLMNHYFEYNYIWKYSNLQMPTRYLVSCFWGGQEGSSMLWIFWQVVVGNILIFSSKKWERSVMIIFGMIQFFLISMLLGVYIGDIRIGSNPFLLTRQLPENLNLPWVAMENYLSLPFFQNGRGLNPLLQNYWMTIHPPTLFLGFALTSIPFCYSIAGLLSKEYTSWIKPAIPWTFIGIGILGTGILMGGAWAYESLSFGGFWAWDPVENAILIPWLTLVGAGHLMLVNKTKVRSLFTTIVLTQFTFILILYSTFLTRSGILGETSVHAFTENGMLVQLLFCILFFIWLSVYATIKDKKQLLIFNTLSVFILIMGFLGDYESKMIGNMGQAGILWILSSVIVIYFMFLAYTKYIPRAPEEEKFWSREFWMFLGSILLLMASLQIIFFTSAPVWNKLFGVSTEVPDQRNLFYNAWQSFFSIFIFIAIAIGQFLSYQDTSIKKRKKILFSLVISIIISALILIFVFSFENMKYDSLTTRGEQLMNQLIYILYPVLLFVSVFSIIANLEYWIKFLKGKLNHAGASLAHIGIGFILLGALISNSQGVSITQNDENKMDIRYISEDFTNHSDAMLMIGDTILLSDYYLLYKGKVKEGINIYYEVDYFHINKNNSLAKNEWKVGDFAFTLKPFVQTNEEFGNAAEPGTKHFVSYDIFSHVRYADVDANSNDGFMPSFPIDSLRFENDTIVTPHFVVLIDQISKKEIKGDTITELGEISKKINTIEIYQVKVKLSKFEQPFQFNDSVNLMYSLIDGLILQKDSAIAMNGNAKIALTEVASISNDSISKVGIKLNLAPKEYIILQAKTFPLINVLWIGCILMLIGTIMAVKYRVKESKKNQ